MATFVFTLPTDAAEMGKRVTKIVLGHFRGEWLPAVAKIDVFLPIQNDFSRLTSVGAMAHSCLYL
jgi:hypothetical protein